VLDMSMVRARATEIQVCANYEFSDLYTPDSAWGTDSRVFTIYAPNRSWQAVGIGDTGSCTVDQGTHLVPPPLPTHPTPSAKSASQSIIRYYDAVGPYAGQYTMQAVRGVAMGEPAGNYVSACVTYAYVAVSPGTDSGTDHRRFLFRYSGSGW